MSVTAVEAAIVARLEAQLKATGIVRAVYTAADYADLPEASLVTPSVAVIYSGYTPGEGKAQGALQNIGFGFMVVVAVRNARATQSGQGVRDEASPIFDAALEALLGFRPIAKFQPLKLEAGPGAALSDAGFGYFPIAFSTTATYRGIPAN